MQVCVICGALPYAPVPSSTICNNLVDKVFTSWFASFCTLGPPQACFNLCFNLWGRKWKSFRYIHTSTYIKRNKNELTELEIIIQKYFGLLLQVISKLLLWMGLFWMRFQKRKMWKFYYEVCFDWKLPTIISSCHWKHERLGMKFIHSFIYF